MDYYEDISVCLDDYNEVSQRLDDARDWFQEAIDIMYGKKPFDVGQLENSLDELGAYLNCRIPKNDLQVTIRMK